MVVNWDEKIAGVKGNSKNAKVMRAYFKQQKEMAEKVKRGLTHEDHLVRMAMSTAGLSKAEATRAVTGRSPSGGRRRKGGKRTKRRASKKGGKRRKSRRGRKSRKGGGGACQALDAGQAGGRKRRGSKKNGKKSRKH